MVQGNIVQRQPTSSTGSSPRTLLAPRSNSSASPATAEGISSSRTSFSSSIDSSSGTATTSSPPAFTSPADSKPHFTAADIGIGIASAIGFLAFVALGIWLYRQGQISQSMAYKRHVKRLSARRDEEAGLVGNSTQPRSGFGNGFKKGVRCKNGCRTYKAPGDTEGPPINLAELIGSAPDNMMI